MDRWPIIITLGAALLGWVAGEMAVGDPFVKDWVDANAGWLHYAAPAAGVVLVVAVGKLLAARIEVEEDERPVVDLAVGDQPGASPSQPADIADRGRQTTTTNR